MIPADRKTPYRKPNDPANHFTVPKGYFESLQQQVLSKVREEEAIENEKRPLLDVLRPYLYLAAMFVGLALIINVLPMIHSGSEDTATKTELYSAEDSTPEGKTDEEVFDQFIWEDTQDEYLVSTYFAY